MEKKGPRAQHLASRPSQPPDHEEQPPPRSPAPPQIPGCREPRGRFYPSEPALGFGYSRKPRAGWMGERKEGKLETYRIHKGRWGLEDPWGSAGNFPCSAPRMLCLWRRDATTPARPQKPGTTLPLQTHSRSSLLRAGKLSPNPRSWWSSSFLRFPG